MRGSLTARFHRTISAICLVAYLSGCTGWHAMATMSPAPADARPQFLRVTMKDRHRLELRDARITGDSVIGEAGFRPNRVRTAVALRDVSRLEDRQVSAGNTSVAVLGLLAAMGVGFLAIASSVHTGYGCFCGSGN